MPRKSSIDLLPAETVADLKARMLSGKFTLDDLTDWLNDQDFEISRSAVGRYSQRVEEIGVHMRESQQMAEALALQVGPAFKDGTQHRMLVDILSTLAFRVMTTAVAGDPDSGEGGPASAQDLHFMARTLKDIASASKITDERERSIAAAARAEAAERVEAQAGQQGWSAETVAVIRHAVLGTSDAGGA